jgi:tetratricopeptide (TPR) repeat protein
MMEAVHRYEGTVNQVMGDGIMALFGAPLALEEHALRACYAALAMQEAIRRYTEEAESPAIQEVRIRVGLNSGEVVVRAINTDLHMDYSAIGQTTNLAARMEQTAPPGSILLTAETFRLVDGYVDLRRLGLTAVKGLAAPIEVFELIGTVGPGTRLSVSAARGLTPFVGRQTELEVLPRALARAAGGRGQIVAMVGEAGVGKSRLLWEFTNSPQCDGWTVLQSRSLSYGKATTYLPIVELLKNYFAIDDRDDPDDARDKVIQRVLALDKALEPALAPILALLHAPVNDDDEWSALEPRQRRQRTLDGVQRLFLRQSQAQPLLLVLEDLHWIDSETQAFLDSLVERLPTARILLLVNYRPEYDHRWGGKGHYTQLRIDPLVPENAQELLQALLGEGPNLQSLAQMLIDRTEGNPFFLEETVRGLAETGALVGQRGGYTLTKPITSLQIPGTVQAILAARIDRLDIGDKHLIQCASVIGRDLSLGLLHALADVAMEDVQAGVDRLQAAEFLYETNVGTDREYTFKHALTHDVAYGSLLHERRRQLHARTAESIERLHTDRLAELVERLALHAFRGEVWPKALHYFHRAGTTAMARAAYREAATALEQSLVSLGHMPKTREVTELGIDLRLDLRSALYPLGEFEQMVKPLREAERAAQEIGDARRLCWVSLHLGDYYRQTAALVEACELTERAHGIAATLDDPVLLLQTGYILGLARYGLGEFQRAADHIRVSIPPGESAEESARQFRHTQSGSVLAHRIVVLSWLTRCLAQCGRFEEGIASGREALTMAEGIENAYSQVQACTGLGLLYGIKAEYELASHLLERAMSTARRWNLALLEPQATRYLGWVYACSGRVDDGLLLLQEAARAVESRDLRVQEATVRRLLGEAHLLAGRLDEASAHAGHALSVARQRRQRGDEAYSLHLLGAIATAQDPADTDEARRFYRDALALGEELGIQPLVARCHLALGRLTMQLNDDAAADHVVAAIRRFCEMDMKTGVRDVAAAVKAAQHLLIVAADQRPLCEYLDRVLTRDQHAAVILDRRRHSSTMGVSDERRRPPERDLLVGLSLVRLAR